MAKPQYGPEHQRIRARLLRELVPGTLCRGCEKPMFKDQELDASHSEDWVTNPNAKADHLRHASCNRGDGGRLGNARRDLRLPAGW